MIGVVMVIGDAPMTAWLVATAFACAGLIVGSFLNVCIYRLPRRESIVWPGSRCTACQRPIAWYDNIPVVSWVALGGRCRTCRTRIAMMYPAVEIATAVAFTGGYLAYGWHPILIVRLVFACAMVVLCAIDLEHHILPDVITLPGIVVGFGNSLLLPPGMVPSLIGIVAGGGILWALSEAYLWIRGHEGLGFGDVKMLAMIGAFLGWRLMLVSLFIASLTGSMVGIAVIATGRGGMKSALPFGSFLAVGALVAGVAGEQLLAWYLSLY